MKIRHKQSGVVLEGEFMRCERSGFMRPTRNLFVNMGTESVYDCCEWEAVQPEPKQTFRSRYECCSYDFIMQDLHGRIECLERKEPA
jgi:hypothetical protein